MSASAATARGAQPNPLVLERTPKFDRATLAVLEALRDAHGRREAARLELAKGITLSRWARDRLIARIDKATVDVVTHGRALNEALRLEAVERA